MTRLLRTYLPRVKGLLAFVVVFQTAQSVLSLYLPRLTGDVVNKGVLAGESDQVWSIGRTMLAVTVGQALCMIVGSYFAARASMAAGAAMRTDLFHRVTAYSAKEVGQLGAPTLITRITNDVTQAQMIILMLCQTAVMAPVTAVYGVTMSLQQDAGLAVVLVVAVPMLALVIGILMLRMYPVFGDMQDRLDDVNQVLREQITGLRVVRAFVREQAERRRFEAENGQLTRRALQGGRLMAFMFPTVMLIQNVASVAIIWLGASRVESGQTNLGDLFSFLGYIVFVLMAVMMASFMFVMLPRAAVSAHRIMEVLDLHPSVLPPDRPRPVPPASSLELREVTFGYPGALAPVVNGVSFTVERGRTTAIIGSTGAGKTTLLNLIPRLYDVSGGAVLLDGIDIRELEPEDLWSQIGLVPQRPFLFSGTVADNLRNGKADATEEEMWEALEVAQGADFVRAMADGLDSSINQGGTNVSGGQRQRLAFARALVRRPPIYLFDDAFSALDLATDARLRAALAPRVADAMVIVVAQRVSTIVGADQIVVLEEGRVEGIGTHAELLASCATYVEIVDSQQAIDEGATPPAPAPTTAGDVRA